MKYNIAAPDAGATETGKALDCLNCVEVSFVFPHQLFRNHPAVEKKRKVILLEDDLFFGQYPFHKKKLVLHRASMKHYANYLLRKGFMVEYVNWQGNRTLSACIEKLHSQGIRCIHYADTTDFLLEKRLTRYSAKYNLKIIRYETPNFLFPVNFIHEYFNRTNRYFQTDFYIHARKTLNILLENGKPSGGSWTFDSENRKALPKEILIPEIYRLHYSDFVKEAETHVNKTFPNNPGQTEGFNYAITFADAQRQLDDFLQKRFRNFGPYQDAIHPDESFLFHSLLAPSLNTGLLQPEYILERTLEYAHHNQISLQSVEGFIRQLIGWREFIRSVYLREGVRQRTTNFFSFTKAIPKAFYHGTTGITPVDQTIKRIHSHAYAHHIERLMVLGNFMLLCEIHPDEVYRWFMELFIDAYDWVMVPNVYGMSQFADGGLMSTKPYISGSNYILKMSRYKKEPWTEIWDGLYWRFLEKHQEKFAANPRMRMMLELNRKMPKEKKKHLFKRAEHFLEKLYD
ncbi:MAG: cryptochrome/photolyase family protein [Cyclobacteriaceae bacterium]|nr:cryptochrome/photolyase family protein [Cyclobacteriaceae bacterium]MDW8332232.1 cryptochrome/photolyase family protein [Cyclobacteriaceae bacterium]